MPELTCDISEPLMRAIAARRARTGEPVQHIVASALADALNVDHATLFQVSTSSALVSGIFDGVVTLAELKQHGDFGLGTFDELDGEMLAVDGRFYHMRADGNVSEAGDDALVPFAVVTYFRAEHSRDLSKFDSFDRLVAELDQARTTSNLFCAARIEGRFERVRTRVARAANSGETLVTATAHQAEFEFKDVDGVLAGFWSPPYARSIAISDWHLHFITADRSGGGHVLDCEGAGLRAELQELADVRISLPATADYMQADLTGDTESALKIAERQR